jgi:hypothetical protein
MPGGVEDDAMRVFFAIVLLGMTPALAQGIVNRRDSSGNLPRDKGVSVPTVIPHALVSSSPQPAVAPPKHVKRAQ